MHVITNLNGEMKMGRRRRRIVSPLRKQLPKIFLCPRCGVNAVYVASKDETQALVTCGNCGFENEVPISPTDKPVDLYCKFTDIFYAKSSQ